MSLTWGEFRTQIRRSILKDVGANTWTDDVLMDLCKWAQDTFCAHTALPTSITYTSMATSLTPPDDAYAPLDTTGRLYLMDVSNRVYPVASTIWSLEQDTESLAFSVWNGSIALNGLPDAGSRLKLYYFAYYPSPTADDSVILLPRWAYSAVAHLIGALAQTREAVQSAGIDRWKTREDSGYPDDNALRAQQQWMMRFYEGEIARVLPQDRDQYYDRVVLT